MNTKGQINQVFIYIMAILVIGLLVLMGFRFIDDLLGKQCDIRDSAFNQETSQSLDEARRYGAQKNIALDAPCKSETLCFINTSQIGTTQFALPEYPVIESSVRDGIEINMYLIDPQGRVTPAGYDPRINTGADESYFCTTTVSNQFLFSVYGLGRDGVLVR